MTPEQVAAWRRAKRTELLARRDEITAEQRSHAAHVIAGKLDRLCAGLTLSVVGLYWPIKQEPSLLPWGRALMQTRGASLCLPVVVAPRAPLEFWRWSPGDAMRPGVWDIPVPERRDPVAPDLVLAPTVGFDQARFRLGYGGGYFDRTLAVLPRRPFAVGVGYGYGALPTIHPQPYDIPMDAIVTDDAADGPT